MLISKEPGSRSAAPVRPLSSRLRRGSSACLHPFLVIVAIVLGIVGIVVKGLLYLLFIGIVVFLVGFL